MLNLIDDGTLDTVFYCTNCRTYIRTNPEPPDDCAEGDWTDSERIESAREIAEDHECVDDADPSGQACPSCGAVQDCYEDCEARGARMDGEL